MDTNQLPNGGYPFSGVPLGFSMALAMNERALQSYAGLTESQKEEIIMRCRNVKSKDEMQKIVDSLVPESSTRSLFKEPGAR